MRFVGIVLGLIFSVSAQSQSYELKTMAPGLLPPDQPYISINPGYISFPNTEINTESSVTATITNSSSVNALQGLRVAVDSSVFTLENNSCGTSATPLSSLGPLESCSTLIKFHPTIPGSYTGTFGAAASNAVNGVQSVMMSAYARGYESFVDMTTDTLNFSVLEGDSVLKTLSFTNGGTYKSTNTRIELTGSPILTLSPSNTCGNPSSPVSIGVNQSCSAPITVSSLTAGNYSAAATLRTANGSPITKTFGVTVNPAISTATVISGSLNFANITPSEAKSATVTIKNTGFVQAPSAFVSIPAIDGLNVVGNSCGSVESTVSIPANSSCNIFLTYSSDKAYSFIDKNVVVQGFDNSLTIPIQGQVIGSESFVEVSPARVAFSAIVPNTDSVTYSFKNTGNIYSQNTYAQISGDNFELGSNSCGSESSPASIAPNGSCSITVVATASSAGSFTGSLFLSSNGSISVSKSLSFNAIGATSIASVTNGSVNFGTVVYDASNTNAVNRTVNITNTGNSALTVNTVSGLPAGTVFQSSTCSNVAVNGTCALVFRMNSNGTTSFTNTAITLNGATDQDAITLTGSVVPKTSIALVTSGSPITFTTVAKGGTASSSSVSIKNTGNSSMTLLGVSGLPAGVAVSANTCSNVAVNSSCSLTFTLSTTNVVSFSNSTVTTIGGTTNADIVMSGTVSGSVASITSGSSVNFGSVAYGAVATKTVDITNTGNTPLTVSYLSGLPIGYMSLTGNTCSNIPANGSCQLTITLNTTSPANISNIAVTTGGASTNGSFNVSSSILFSGAQISPSTYSFGTVFKGDISPSVSLSISNFGNQPMTLTGMSVLPAGVSVSANTCANIAPSSSCSISLSLDTSTTRSISNVSVSTTGANSNGLAYLSGVVQNRTAIASVSQGVAFGSTSVGSASVSKSVTVTNTGNSAMTLTGVSGLPSAVTLTANTCSNITAGGSCSMTFDMSTATATSISAVISTVGGTTNASFNMTGTVTSPNFAFNAIISTSTNNYDVRAAAIAAGWNQTTSLVATVTVNSGVTIGSTSTATPSFSATGSYPAGSSLSLTNNGLIYGKGGDGGVGSSLGGAAGAGGAGGVAVSVSLPTQIANNGTIAGGGGGGGGGGGATGNVGAALFKAAGGGGGAGAGVTSSTGGAAGASSQGSCVSGACPITNATAGGSSTATAGASGGSYGNVSFGSYYARGGNGGAGGSLGSAGSAGSAGSYVGITTPVIIQGAAGGAAGAYASGNSNITWTVVGTRLGSVLN